MEASKTSPRTSFQILLKSTIRKVARNEVGDREMSEGKERFIERESNMHKYAKETVYQWLFDPGILGSWRYRWGDDVISGAQLWMEFPLIDGIADVPDYHFYYPEYFNESGEIPVDKDGTGYFPKKVWPSRVRYVADIAIMYKGVVWRVIEIVYKSPLSDDKIEFYQDWNFEVISLSAEKVMKRYRPPSSLSEVGYK